MRRGGLRIERHNLAQESNTFAALSKTGFDLAGRGECRHVLGRQLQGDVEFSLGLGELPLLGENQPEIEIALRVVRIVFNCLPEQLFGPIDVPLVARMMPKLPSAGTSCGSAAMAASNRFSACAVWPAARSSRPSSPWATASFGSIPAAR